MKLLYLILILSVVLSACGNKSSEENTEETKPNIIYIFPDQFRQYSLGFWSEDDNAKHIQGEPDPVNTPVLDELAHEGMVFSRVISNQPLCSPHRGMLLTGAYPHKNGLTTNCKKEREVGIVEDGNSIADVLRNAGYETAYFGKCHWIKTTPVFDANQNYVGLTNAPGGHYISAFDTYVPAGKSRLGFDYFYQLLGGHMNPKSYSNDPFNVNGKKDGEFYQSQGFSAELESQSIVRYLENFEKQRDSSKPFFITWALNPPHNPWTEEHTKMEFFPQYTENGTVDLDDLLVRGNADKKVGKYAPYYFANVSAVDYYVGKVLAKLKELGMEENTIVVFSSDHGEMLGSHGLTGKNRPEMEALNIPFIVKWSGKVEHRIENLMMSTPDIMPTLLGMIGLQNKIPETVQGRDFSKNILKNEQPVLNEPKSALYIGSGARGIFTGDYTFTVYEKEGKLEKAFLYDNKKDPYQLHKVDYKEVDKKLVKELKNELLQLLKDIEDPWFEKEIWNEI